MSNSNMRKILYLWCLGLICTGLSGQVDVGGFLKNKSQEAKDKAKEKAREKATESLEKQQKEYDESNFNYSICFLDNSGNFEAAEKGNAYSNTLLNTIKAANNEEKSVEDRAYTNLKNGEMLMAGNKYNLAEQSLKLAKFLYESDGKTSSDNYAQTIGDLGLLYQSRGRYAKAKPFIDQSISLRESGENKGKKIVALNNRAVYKKETGQYVEAESDFKKTLTMAEEQKDDLAKALLYNNLAMTCVDMNKLNEAEQHMDHSLQEASKVLTPNSSNFIKLQINQASIFRMQKKYAKAEELYLQAISIKEKKLGTHPDLANLKQGLAQLYMDMGKTGEVEKLLLSAYDIYKKKLGEKNPATVSAQQELANFYRFTDKNAKAQELITKVVENKKSIYGETHPNYIQALEDQALAQWQGGKIPEAKNNYKVVIDNTLQYINTFFNSLNENEKTLYWEKTNSRLQRYFAFSRTVVASDAEWVKQLYTTVISTKGFLLNGSTKIRNAIAEGSDEDLKTLYAQWQETKEYLNQAYQLSKEEIAEEKINVDSLKRRQDELERQLSQKSAAFKEGISAKPVRPEDIRSSLKPNERAVELVEISDYQNGYTGKEYYVALVVSPDAIKAVELGEGAPIQNAVQAFREKVTNIKPENEAYAATWKVVDEAMQGVGKLYISADGVYHQLSINALKDATGKYMADKYAIVFTGNTRDIPQIKQSESIAVKPVSAFLIGNPSYGKNGIIEQLPGTEAEVKNINKLLGLNKVKTTLLIGAKATESAVKQVNSPGILHIATHGYFLADLSQMETNKVLGVDIAAARENPLLRSGVLLSNCDNVFDPNYHPSAQSENGILTAYEAMSLNLDKTDLVVLSACETGLGSVKQGEGVYGLQRAFLIAGARSVIMSLWSVSDEATMQLMTLFYTNYSKSGNRNQAFNDAIRQLKTKFKEPFYWSAFVMLNH